MKEFGPKPAHHQQFTETQFNGFESRRPRQLQKARGAILGLFLFPPCQAALEELERPTTGRSPNLRSIVDRIRPSVESLPATELRHNPEALAREAVRPAGNRRAPRASDAP